MRSKFSYSLTIFFQVDIYKKTSCFGGCIQPVLLPQNLLEQNIINQIKESSYKTKAKIFENKNWRKSEIFQDSVRPLTFGELIILNDKYLNLIFISI